MLLTPIGTFHGDAHYKIQAPRQGAAAGGGRGVVRLVAGRELELALRDLEGFSHVWLLYAFHQNSAWKPLVRPPLPPAGRQRVGVFASRSPYRPNPIGMSCVRLLAVRGLELEVEGTDLLDGTPILDIKPYVPQWDSVPEAVLGWVPAEDGDFWEVCSSAEFRHLAECVLRAGGPDLEAVATAQLSHRPWDSSRKRVQAAENGDFVFAYRTWRLRFRAEVAAADGVALDDAENAATDAAGDVATDGEAPRRLLLLAVASGYGAEELAAGAADPYGDKGVHRLFATAGGAGGGFDALAGARAEL